MDAAQQRIEDLHQRNPLALRLAELSCLAVRVEPALLRRLRQRFLPRADPSAELDLWFSPLVQTRSASALVYDLGVLARLRAALAGDERRDEVYRATLDHFAGHPERTRLEIALNAQPVLDRTVDDATLERWLAPLLADLRGGGASALQAARWVLQAAPRWHPRVRATGGAWAAVMAASALLGGRRLLAGSAPRDADPARLAAALPAGSPGRRPLGVAMTRRRLRLLPAGEGTPGVEAAATSPALLVVEIDGQPPQVLAAEPGTELPLPGVRSLVLRNLLGERWRVEPGTRSGAAEAPDRPPVQAALGVLQARSRPDGGLAIDVRLTTADGTTTRATTLAPHDVELIRRSAWARSEAIGAVGDPWQNLPTREWQDALAPLADAEAIVLDADDAVSALPWERLELRGERIRDPLHLALRLLRARPPTAPGGASAAPPRDGLGRALVITNPGPRSLEALPELSAEGRRLADALVQRTALKVERLDRPGARPLLAALLSAPCLLLHLSARGLVGGGSSASAGAPGIPLDDAGTWLGAAELRQLERAPELAVLNLDDSGDAPVWAGRRPADRALLPAHALLQLGTTMLLATAGKTSPAASTAFVATFYDRLLAGQTLLQAIVAARERTRADFPQDDTWSRYQAWGEPDDRFSAARAPRAPRRVPPRAILAVSAGDQPPNTGFWTADGFAVSTGLVAAGADEWNASDGERSWRLQVDRPTEAESAPPSLVIVARLAAVDAAPAASLPLARGLPRERPFAARLLARSERGFDEVAVQAAAGRDARHLVLSLARDGDDWPESLAGAPVVVDGRCVAIVVGFDRAAKPAWVEALSVAAVRAALQAAAQRREQARLREAQAAVVGLVPGQDVVVMRFDEGLDLTVGPATAAELMATPDEGPLARWLRKVDVVHAGGTGNAELVASPLVQRLDAQASAGLYALHADALGPLKGGPLVKTMPPPQPVPELVLIHGVLLDTASTFGDLWAAHPGDVKALFERHHGRVWALEQATVGVHPIANALQLAQACAPGARLHLLTHSTGGVVAELLARVCADPGRVKDLLVRLPEEMRVQRSDLMALADAVARRGLRVERIVRVAAPMRGTPLAADRLDLLLSMFRWAWGRDRAAPPDLGEFIAEVARRRAGARDLPGLSVLRPDDPLLAWLNAPAAPLPGSLRIVCGEIVLGGLWQWLAKLLSREAFSQPTDGVVPVASALGGVLRSPPALAFVASGKEVNHFGYFAQPHSARAIVDALLLDEPPGYRPVAELRQGDAPAP